MNKWNEQRENRANGMEYIVCILAYSCTHTSSSLLYWLDVESVFIAYFYIKLTLSEYERSIDGGQMHFHSKRTSFCSQGRD